MTNKDKTTELFLEAQGYEQEDITKAISVLMGNDESFQSPLLTPKELCTELKISTTTLWRLNPPHVVIGSRKRYRLSEVEGFLANQPLS